MARKQTFWDKFWRDEHGRDIIWQKPNRLLIIWLGASFINLFLRGGTLQDVIGWIGAVAIFFWALREAVWGVNYFWKLIGFCALFLVIFTKFF